MAEVLVTRCFDESPEALWGAIRAFDQVAWIPGGENAEIRGEGVGQVRIFSGPGGSVHEVLEAREDDTRTLVYTIPQGVPFPVTGYRATMVVDEDQDRGRLSWTCEFEPVGVSEQEARNAIETMYGVMMDWLADGLRQSS